MIRHEKKTKFPCDKCAYVSNVKSDLYKHMRVVHENIKGNHKCDHCDKVFESKFKMAKHALIEHNIIYK